MNVGPGRPLAILCGGGEFPFAVAAAAKANGRAPLMIGVEGSADRRVEAFEHAWVHMGQIGRLFALLKSHAIADLAIIGSMTRPEWGELRLDWGAVSRATRLAPMFRGGDNALLVGIAGVFEDEGLKIVGAHEIAPQLLCPSGAIGAIRPDAQAQEDAARGAALVGALSPFDAGQAAVVAQGRVIAVEAAEGTDAMLERVAQMRAANRLRFKGRAGVLVKAPKRGQDMRFDLPAAGPKTIEAAARAQLQGVALAAGKTLIADRAALAAVADAAGIFVIGLAL